MRNNILALDSLKNALSNRNILVLSVSVSLLMFSFSLYQSFWPVYLLEQGLDLDLVALLSVIGMSSRLLAQLPGGILADTSRISQRQVTKQLTKITANMQNKPNLPEAQMNVSSVITEDYENIRLHRRRKNKPNQTQYSNEQKNR